MLQRIDHIDLRVSDLEKTEEFFHTLGLKTLRKIGNSRNSIEMALPGDQQVIFELRQVKEGQSSGINHIGFAADCDQAISDLEQNGIQFTSKNRFIAETGRTVSNFNGPDASKWQVSIVREEKGEEHGK